ncbi:hypothetical protein EEL32_06745 [Brevibacillus laterosporus]|nr:hypothetical protein EEL32_06745 [Brevibacillus laterosporus]
MGEERIYLSAIKDLCTHEIIAYHISYIYFYNEERLQLKLNKLTPSEFRRQLAA